ncbi:MAG: phosphomannomutase/phosphoglucomutase [Firmicutes bacterium]|nr:phosphomannomutase/phosphoglucomutase [Bacillota bacterium]
MKDEIFRAYDIRGKYPEDINEELAYTIGRSYGSYIQEKYNQKKCIVSRDNRLSSESLTQSLIKGITSTGCLVINYGLTTTPMNYYGRYLNQLPGIMVTASHNPKDDNGFKISFDKMLNATAEELQLFKEYTKNANFLKGQGAVENNGILEKYIEYLKYAINFGKRKRKVIFDCGNGVTSTVLRKIMNNFNIDFEIINEENDGNFPSHHPDPAVVENLTQLQAAVKSKRADVGIAFDGDGDRIGVVMENGQVMPIEHYIILMIRDIAPNAANKTFLYDIKCSKSIQDEIDKLNAQGICYRTGASYTQKKVLEDNLPFGAEFSGHIFFRDRTNDCASAIYAALRLIEVLSKTNEKLSKLVKNIPNYFTTPEIKIPTTVDKKFMVVEKIKAYAKEKRYPFNDIDGVRINFTNGWALIRGSNTGENIIFRAEATTNEGLQNLQNIFIPLINDYNKN